MRDAFGIDDEQRQKRANLSKRNLERLPKVKKAVKDDLLSNFKQQMESFKTRNATSLVDVRRDLAEALNDSDASKRRRFDFVKSTVALGGLVKANEEEKQHIVQLGQKLQSLDLLRAASSKVGERRWSN